MAKKFFTILVIAILVFFAVRYLSGQRAPLVFTEFTRVVRGGPQVRVGNNLFSVDIADTVAERTQGLSGRQALGKNQGMVFFFDEPDLYGFWMKGMLFPIDIVWIREYRVIGVSEDLPPASEASPRIYYPPSLVDTVLEVRAGEVQDRGIAVGEQVELLLE